MLPTKFLVNLPFRSGEEAKNRFSRCGHGGQLGFQLVVTQLGVTLMLPTKFQVNWPFGSGEETKNRFSRGLPWRPSWVSAWNDFSYFWSTSHPNAFYQVWSQLAFQFRRRRETDFQDGVHGGQLGFPILTILDIFGGQLGFQLVVTQLGVTLMLPTNFRVNWPFGSVEEAKNRFSRWPSWLPSWVSDQKDFSYF